MDERKQNELKKLYELRGIYSVLSEIRDKIGNVTVEDNYERTVKVPDFKVQPPEAVDKLEEPNKTKKDFIKSKHFFGVGFIIGSIIAGRIFLSFLLSPGIELFLIFVGIVATIGVVDVLKYRKAVAEYCL